MTNALSSLPSFIEYDMVPNGCPFESRSVAATMTRGVAPFGSEIYLSFSTDTTL